MKNKQDLGLKASSPRIRKRRAPERVNIKKRPSVSSLQSDRVFKKRPRGRRSQISSRERRRLPWEEICIPPGTEQLLEGEESSMARSTGDNHTQQDDN
ncbi:hypothetical protein TNCV_2499351 [Trichonephila clavipes]|nr:hypothetical protein TNCV_2499351 [Trichonephila clavipes]